MKGSRRIPKRAPARPERRPSRRAVLGKQRPISPQFTVWFDGPRAMDAFSSLVDALSPCTYKIILTGDHYEISFDTLPARRGRK